LGIVSASRVIKEQAMEVHDVVGALGVFLIVGTYLLLQLGKIGAKELRYSLVNAVGAALVLVSLYSEFNLSAALIEGFWLAISIFGLAKSIQKR
jgi:hypothetical protein